MITMEQSRQALKIAFIGLANAGKTSLIRSLTREFEMLTRLKPTTNVERNFLEFLGKELVFWDFGGQEKYREKYIKSAERYFNEISTLFYVIDVQDPLILVPNISYFQSIHDQLNDYSPNAQLVLLFHKADPEFMSKLKANKTQIREKSEKKDETCVETDVEGNSSQEDIEMVDTIQKFLEAISPILEKENKPVLMFQTSIYNPLSIITAISQPLFNDKDLYTNINNILKSFCDTYGLLFAILFSKNFFEIGKFESETYLKDFDDTDMKKVFYDYFNEYNVSLDKNIDPNWDEKAAIESGLSSNFELKFDKFQLLSSQFIIQFANRKLPFNLAIGYNDDAVLMKDGLDIALSRMDDNLQKIFMNIDLVDLLEKMHEF
jgi:Ras-related GTP-binding protein A/B